MLYEHTVVELQEVHTSLQSKHFREESGLEHHLSAIEVCNVVRQVVRYRRVYIIYLPPRIFVECRGYVAGGEIDGVGTKEVEQTFVIRTRTSMNFFIKNHGGEIS